MFHQWENGESFEVFEVSQMEATYNRQNDDHGNQFTIYDPGWYWWPREPDEIPLDPAVGPFDTEQDALNNAMGE